MCGCLLLALKECRAAPSMLSRSLPFTCVLASLAEEVFRFPLCVVYSNFPSFENMLSKIGRSTFSRLGARPLHFTPSVTAASPRLFQTVSLVKQSGMFVLSLLGAGAAIFLFFVCTYSFLFSFFHCSFFRILNSRYLLLPSTGRIVCCQPNREISYFSCR